MIMSHKRNLESDVKDFKRGYADALKHRTLAIFGMLYDTNEFYNRGVDEGLAFVFRQDAKHFDKVKRRALS